MASNPPLPPVDFTQDDYIESSSRSLSRLPIHAVPKASSLRNSRPPRLERAPISTDLEYHAETAAAKIAFIEEDPVVQAVQRRGETTATLNVLKIAMAREAAGLRFQILELEKLGKDTSQTVSRRVEVLTRIAAIESELRKSGGDNLDLRGAKFQAIFKYLIDRISETATEVLPSELLNLFFNRLGTSLEGWEEHAAEVAKDTPTK